jgi:hypothetical protein
MATTGFILILINAINYIFKGNSQSILLIIGLVFVVIGMKMNKKLKI